MDPDTTSSSGHPGPSAARRTEERRVVTTLFCDLVGFTALSERNDPEVVDAFLRRYYAAARTGGRVLRRHGREVHRRRRGRRLRRAGRCTRTTPSAPCAPACASSTSSTPCRASAARRVEVRVGVNTGEALVRLDVDPGERRGLPHRRRRQRGRAPAGARRRRWPSPSARPRTPPPRRSSPSTPATRSR